MKRSWRIMLVFLIIVGIVLPVTIMITIFRPPQNKLQVTFIPEEINTCSGQIAWFLAEISGSEAINGKFNITISTNVSIPYESILWPSPGSNTLEILLYPNESHVDLQIEVSICVNTSTSFATDSALVDVWNWTPSEQSAAEEKRDVFVEYLGTNFPELGINDTLTWTAICNDAGFLIVGHYLFKSEYWEMEISWHVMIPPYDWVKCYIRHRSDPNPSWAGEISSWNNSDPVSEISPPSQIFRPR
jgi:hypothetical protein